jgi:uncharacterized membrane protein YhhN
MTTATGLFLVAAVVAAVVDWWAVGFGHRRVEYVAKPLALVFVIGVAATIDADDARVRALVLAGLAFSLLGDVALMLDRFLPGVAAFGLAQLCYLVAFVPLPHELWRFVFGAVGVVAVLSTVGARVVRGAAAANRRLGVPVLAYMLLLGSVVLAGVSTESPVLAIGVTLFGASDTLNGWRRFVGPTPGGRVLVHATYHVGQLCIAVALSYVAWGTMFG